MLSKLTSWRKPKQLDLETYFAKLKAKGLNKDGSPVLDPVPLAPPIGYKKHPSMVEIVRDMVRGERLAQAARDAGHETFEQSEDFGIEDEPDQLRSEHENERDPSLEDLLAAGADAKAVKEKSNLPSEVPKGPDAPGGGSPAPDPGKPLQDPPKGS